MSRKNRKERRMRMMIRFNRNKMLAMMTAAILATTPVAVVMPTYAATTTLPSGTNLKPVDETGTLSVSIPSQVSGSFEVKAYEMLQLVIPKGTTWTSGTSMTNDNNSKNLYVVTDTFQQFFATAKSTYTNATTPLTGEDTLYLTYNVSANHLVISKTEPSGTENEDYIKIDNTAYSDGHKGRLDTTYFEADLVSRIIDSNPISSEVGASAARLFSDWASRYVKAESIAADQTATKEGTPPTTFQFTGLKYGYYVIITSDDTQDGDKSVINQSILNVPMATDVTLKATPITIDKSVTNLVDANKNNNEAADKKNDDTTRIDVDSVSGEKYDKITANIGDILQYKIESHIPSYTSYDFSDGTKLLGIADTDNITEDNFATQISGKFVYTFRDKMTNQNFIATDGTVSGVEISGLKVEVYNVGGTEVEKTFVVKNVSEKYYLFASTETIFTEENAVGRLWETEYDSSTQTNFFAINFLVAKLKAQNLDGRKIVFTYNAELMGEAGNNNSNNVAKFTYSNDPYDASTTDTIDDEDQVYTYDLKIDKKFSDGATTDYYDKVKFKLYSDEAKTKAVKFVFNSATGVYNRADSDDVLKVEELAISTTDGTLQLHGLGEGTYYLVEQENTALSSAGYTKANPITVVIKAKNDSGIIDATNFDLFNGDTKASTVTRDEVALTVTKVAFEYGIGFDVLNQKGFRLPLTGEHGNWMLAICGIVLVAVGGTVIILVNRKKKDITSADEN